MQIKSIQVERTSAKREIRRTVVLHCSVKSYFYLSYEMNLLLIIPITLNDMKKSIRIWWIIQEMQTQYIDRVDSINLLFLLVKYISSCHY